MVLGRPLASALFVLLLIFPVISFSEDSALPTGAKVVSEDGRFVDNGDLTITDTQTGIMWLKNDSFQQTGHWMNWGESIDFIQKLNEEAFATYIDWQMPQVKDLKTLYEPGKLNSKQLGREMKIHMDPIFTNQGAGALWSSEENGRFNGFGLIFNNGARFSAPKTSRGRKAVRAMRFIHP